MKMRFVTLILLLLVGPTGAAAESLQASSPDGQVNYPLEGSGIHGLSGFRLSFAGDHKIQTIGVAVSSGQAWGWLEDSDGKDPMTLNVDYWPGLVGRNLPRVEKRRCEGTCKLKIEKPRPGEVFVLTGFHFRRWYGDSHVKTLSVDPDPSEGRLRVTFEDKGTFPYTVWVSYAYVELDRYVTARASGKTGRKNGRIDLDTPARAEPDAWGNGRLL